MFDLDEWEKPAYQGRYESCYQLFGMVCKQIFEKISRFEYQELQYMYNSDFYCGPSHLEESSALVYHRGLFHKILSDEIDNMKVPVSHYIF